MSWEEAYWEKEWFAWGCVLTVYIFSTFMVLKYSGLEIWLSAKWWKWEQDQKGADGHFNFHNAPSRQSLLKAMVKPFANTSHEKNPQVHRLHNRGGSTWRRLSRQLHKTRLNWRYSFLLPWYYENVKAVCEQKESIPHILKGMYKRSVLLSS